MGWLVLGILYLSPLLQGVGFSFGNVPFFALWATVIGPILMIALYAINSYLRIEADKTTERGESAATGANTTGGE
jgi:4-hydroxybenzoate polyprenyltransferase